MKKVILLAGFALQSLLAAAQLFVEGTALGTSNTSAYLEATPLRRTDGSYHFHIDYGQKVASDKKQCLTDDKGRRFEFRSTVDGLNFLYENGWEVLTVYNVEDLRRYLLRRRF